MPHFPTGGVCSKKFKHISPKICRAGGIPPRPPFHPRAEATLSDLPACLPAGRQAGWTISGFSLAEDAFFIFSFIYYIII
jgi:hypothetical protein